MPWTVVYYETHTGETPVEDFLDELSPKARAKCLAYISRLEVDGTQLPASIAKHVRGKIWSCVLNGPETNTGSFTGRSWDSALSFSMRCRRNRKS